MVNTESESDEVVIFALVLFCSVMLRVLILTYNELDPSLPACLPACLPARIIYPSNIING